MKIYSCNITDISEAELHKSFFAMSKERQKSTLRLQNKQKQKAKIAADRLCRLAISEHCGVSPESIIFTLNEKGKPYAADLNVFFNVSHSGDMVVCAVSDNEIGIDIEKIRPINLKAAEKFACSNEIEYMEQTQNGFFEIWTLKEAYFKCIGTGLGNDIKTVSFGVNSNKILCSAPGFECAFHSICNGYICSTCKKIR